VIFKCGAMSESLYIIKKGHINILLPDDEYVHATLLDGSAFGENVLVPEYCDRRTYSARARSWCDLLSVSKEDLLATLHAFEGFEELVLARAKERFEKVMRGLMASAHLRKLRMTPSVRAAARRLMTKSLRRRPSSLDKGGGVEMVESRTLGEVEEVILSNSMEPELERLLLQEDVPLDELMTALRAYAGVTKSSIKKEDDGIVERVGEAQNFSSSFRTRRTISDEEILKFLSEFEGRTMEALRDIQRSLIASQMRVA
jgi:CRP-like cAMP-binding protein